MVIYINPQKHNVMKKLQTVAIILLLITLSCHSVAQTTFSTKRELLGGLNSNKVLTCEFMSKYVITYSTNNNSNIRHFFTIQNMYNNVVIRFPMSIGYDPVIPATNYTKYVVNDMKVSTDGVCYFCGRRISGINGMSSSVTSKGFIGKFSIADVISNNTPNIKLFIIDGTAELTRIDPSGSYEQVFAVGYSDGFSLDPYNNTPCSYLVGLDRNPQGSTWHYDLVRPTLYFERFTDVANASGIIVTSKYDNDNYHIGLRHTKNGPLNDNLYLTQINNCNKYDMATAVTPSNVSVACRKNNDSILMSSDGGGGVTMAHSCYNVANGIAAYLLYVHDLGDARVSKARYSAATSYIHLNDITTYSANPKAFFLATDNTNSSSLLSQTDWLSSGVGLMYPEYSFSSSDLICQDLECFCDSSYSQYLYIGGYTSSHIPAYYAKNLTSSSSLFTCLPGHSFKNFIQLQNPTYSSGSGVDLDNTYFPHEVSEIIVQNIVATTITPTTTCNY